MNSIATLSSAAQLLRRIPLTLIIGLAALAIALVPAAGDALQLDRSQLAAGEIWRLATCHLTHWNAEHLQWDLLMFVVLGAACELRIRQRMRRCVAFAAAAVTAVVLIFFPEIEAYRGLSGIDTALFTLLAIELMCEARRDGNRVLVIATGGLLVGFAAKTGYEAVTGHTFFVDQQAAGFVPLVWDHVVAGVVGAFFAIRALLSATSTQSTATRYATALRRLIRPYELWRPALKPACEQPIESRSTFSA